MLGRKNTVILMLPAYTVTTGRGRWVAEEGLAARARFGVCSVMAASEIDVFVAHTGIRRIALH